MPDNRDTRCPKCGCAEHYFVLQGPTADGQGIGEQRMCEHCHPDCGRLQCGAEARQQCDHHFMEWRGHHDHENEGRMRCTRCQRFQDDIRTDAQEAPKARDDRIRAAGTRKRELSTQRIARASASWVLNCFDLEDIREAVEWEPEDGDLFEKLVAWFCTVAAANHDQDNVFLQEPPPTEKEAPMENETPVEATTRIADALASTPSIAANELRGLAERLKNEARRLQNWARAVDTMLRGDGLEGHPKDVVLVEQEGVRVLGPRDVDNIDVRQVAEMAGQEMDPKCGYRIAEVRIVSVVKLREGSDHVAES